MIAAADPYTGIAAIIGAIGVIVLGYWQARAAQHRQVIEHKTNRNTAGVERNTAVVEQIDKRVDAAAKRTGELARLEAISQQQHMQFVELVRLNSEQLRQSTDALLQVERDKMECESAREEDRTERSRMADEIGALRTQLVAVEKVLARLDPHLKPPE